MIPPYKGVKVNTLVNIELGNSEKHQLYYLSEDIGEQKNMADEETEKLLEMITIFAEIRGENGGAKELELH